MKIYKARVAFCATDTKEEYGHETYFLVAAKRSDADKAALKMSEESHYDDVRVDHYRRVYAEVALESGDLILMPDPDPALNDAWAHGNWEGRVVNIRGDGKLVTVCDQDDDWFDIETERVIALLKEKENA